MALIKCPECKKTISDQCENCPNCGYPIGQIRNEAENRISDIIGANEEQTRRKKAFNFKRLAQKVWFWVSVGVVILAITVAAILVLNCDTKPKIDKDGNPVFVELTNEVYTNADKYLGYYIEVKGIVFQVMSDDGSVKGIQIWIDPDTCEQNMMIYYNTNVDVKQGDYVLCTGYIDSVTEYKNVYGAKLYAPTIISADLKKATYIDVMSPTIETITPQNLKQEKYGYSVSIDKIEFSEKETRVYVTAINNGRATLNIGDAVIVQNGKQYNSTYNFEADYDEIPHELVKGALSSGIIVFPAISVDELELTIILFSDNYTEDLDQFMFKISVSTTTNQPNNKNQEAVKSAEEIADFYATVYPNMVKELLISDYGYSESQALYAISNADIDWNYYAAIHLKDYVLMNEGNVTEGDAERYLSVDKGYSSAAIQYAFANTDIDWRTNEDKNSDKTPTNTSAVGTYIGNSSKCTFSLTLYADGTVVHRNETIDLLIYRGTWTQQGSTVSFALQFQNFEEIEYYDTTLYTDGMQFMDFFYKKI